MLQNRPEGKSWKKFTGSGPLVGLGDQGQRNSQEWEDEREGLRDCPSRETMEAQVQTTLPESFVTMLRWWRKRASRPRSEERGLLVWRPEYAWSREERKGRRWPGPQEIKEGVAPVLRAAQHKLRCQGRREGDEAMEMCWGPQGDSSATHSPYLSLKIRTENINLFLCVWM